MTVAFLDTVHPILKNRLKENGFLCKDYLTLSRDDIIQGSLTDIDGIVLRSRLQIDVEILQSLPNLKWIARSGSGLENIDLIEANARDIHVYNSPEGNRDAVGEHVLGMILMILHKLRSCDITVHERVWAREKHRGSELSSKTVGILGYGEMGSAFASKLKGLGCKVIAYDKYKKGFSSEFVEEVSEEEFFKKSEIISIHVPWTSETKNLVNTSWLSKFKKTIVLINSSRGAVVNTSDLLDAIDNGQVSSIGLDVLEFEGNSLECLDKLKDAGARSTLTRLLESPNAYLSPHVAGWTTESYIKLSTYLANKILKDFSAKS
jgi:D-3-phosphoglycerate dehydrogenase / 2-oxoglutarate reductase